MKKEVGTRKRILKKKSNKGRTKIQSFGSSINSRGARNKTRIESDQLAAFVNTKTEGPKIENCLFFGVQQVVGRLVLCHYWKETQVSWASK